MKKTLILFMLAIFCLTVSTARAIPAADAAIAKELYQSQSIPNMSIGVYAIPEKILNTYFSAIAAANPKIKAATLRVLDNNKIMLTINADGVGTLHLTCAVKEFHYDKATATLELYIEKKEIVGHAIKSWFFNTMSLGLITSVYGNPLDGNVDSKIKGNTIDIDLQPFAAGLFNDGLGQSIGDMLIISRVTTATGIIYLHTNCALSLIPSS